MEPPPPPKIALPQAPQAISGKEPPWCGSVCICLVTGASWGMCPPPPLVLPIAQHKHTCSAHSSDCKAGEDVGVGRELQVPRQRPHAHLVCTHPPRHTTQPHTATHHPWAGLAPQAISGKEPPWFRSVRIGLVTGARPGTPHHTHLHQATPWYQTPHQPKQSANHCKHQTADSYSRAPDMNPLPIPNNTQAGTGAVYRA
jgi:hypothetical protein